MACLIGIDVGTTNRKVAAFDDGGCLLAIEKQHSRQAAMCPDELWSDISLLLSRVLIKCGRKPDAVAVASMGEACFPVAGGCALSASEAWYLAKGDTVQIRERIGEEYASSVTGLDLSPIFSLPKLLALRTANPEIFEKAERWVFMADWIVYKLSGQIVTNYTLAGRSFQFDLKKLEYRNDWLKELGFKQPLFPDAVPAGTVVGKVSAETSALTGLPAGLPVVMGGHDHPCAAIVADAFDDSVIFDSSGTAEAFLKIMQPGTEFPKERQGARICPYLDGKRFVIWNSNPGGGISIEWILSLLSNNNDWDPLLLEETKRIKPNTDGLYFVPFLRGAGPPWNDTSIGACFLGLKSYHKKAELIRAVLEGLSYMAKILIESTENIARKRIEKIRVAGGGARIGLWQQIKSDITGYPVECVEQYDATPAGAAALAGIGIGVYPSIEAASKQIYRSGRLYNQNPAMRDNYMTLFEKFKIMLNQQI